MILQLASITARVRTKSVAIDSQMRDFIDRAARLQPVEALSFSSEEALLASTTRQPSRPAAHLVLFDSRGDLLTSEDFALYLGQQRDRGAQRIVFAIGPADGWSAAALARAHRVISFGRITLPHELARVVAAEQIYRALTILAGHPYHSGH